LGRKNRSPRIAATSQKSGHDRPGEKLRNPPHSQQGEQEEQDTGDHRDPGHELGGFVAGDSGDFGTIIAVTATPAARSPARSLRS
jgi:hypothetical protein